jgi:ribosome-binding protein aMBF1 (putative translation factor)
MLRDGRTANEINRWLAEGNNKTWHRNSFSTHRKGHMSALDTAKREATVETVRKSAGRSNADLARLVVDRVIDRIESGDVEPTIPEALRAQEILDRRAERQNGAELMMVLINAIGGPVVPFQIESGIIEGEATEV